MWIGLAFSLKVLYNKKWTLYTSSTPRQQEGKALTETAVQTNEIFWSEDMAYDSESDLLRETLASWSADPRIAATRIQPPKPDKKELEQSHTLRGKVGANSRPFDVGVRIDGDNLCIRNQYPKNGYERLNVTVPLQVAKAAAEAHGDHGSGWVTIPNDSVSHLSIGYGKLSRLLKSAP